MTVAQRFKAPSARSKSVAVIACAADLTKAARLRRRPDLFELRLDALYRVLSPHDARIGALAVPYIVTARDPREGGVGDLGATERRNLLLTFLPAATYVDVELRSARTMLPVLQEAARRDVKRIISVHSFDRAIALEQMHAWAETARKLSADVFKIAVRTDSIAELDRLLTFFAEAKHQLPISAMGVGKLGRRSRIELARRGSAFTYVHLGHAQADGQLSWRDLRRLTGTEVAPSSASA
jgi:3-dehydroquinate dehydratase type I